MLLIGVDYHPSFQTIAFCLEETGEYGEQELNHSDGQAERFYRDLKQRGIYVRVGMEATGYSRWFERLLAELGFELWIGEPAEIKAKRVRKQKYDREDARLLLRLMRENNFPKIWIPSPENRDLRQLLWHRHRLVQMRTRIMNQLQALTMNEGKRWKKKLWSEQGRAMLEKLALAPWASRRRKELLELLMIDGIHFGGQVLVVALGIAEGGEKHILGVWQGATENTTVVKGLLEDLVEVSGGDRRIESAASRCRACLRRASGSTTLPDSQAAECAGVSAGELPERLRPADAQCLRDEQLRGAIRDLTTIATLCIVLLAAKFLAGQKHSEDCERVEALAAGYATRS